MEILGTGGGGVRHDILGGGRVDNITSGPCNRNTEERKYVQVSQSTIITYAESVGIAGLPTPVAKELAIDLTYRLRDIADVASQFLRHSRKRSLTTEVLNKVLKCKKISPILGHTDNTQQMHTGTPHPQSAGFKLVSESDLIVETDHEVDLLRESLSYVENNTLHQMNMKVSCKWLAIQGLNCESDVENRMNVANFNMSPALVQFYSTLISHIIGDSHQLCLMAVQELRRNARLTPLLPYLVSFARWCLYNKYKNNHVITARIIRLISALISNPHLNLSPKPYLTYLVSSLLAFLIKDRDESSSVGAMVHLQLAASVLKDALDRWATPTNQLSSQTLRALEENCKANAKFMQLGALTALNILGSHTIHVIFKVQVFEHLLTGLLHYVQQTATNITSISPVSINIANHSLGLLKNIGVSIIKFCQQKGGDELERFYQMSDLLAKHFGDALLPNIPEDLFVPKSVEKLRKKLTKAKVRVKALKKLSPNLAANHDRRFMSQSDNFTFFANMGVPIDIFEAGGDMFSKSRLNGGDGSVQVKLSECMKKQFPDAIAVTLPAKTLKLNVSACTQVPSHFGSKVNVGISRKEKFLPCTYLIAASKLKFMPKTVHHTNYLELISTL